MRKTYKVIKIEERSNFWELFITHLFVYFLLIGSILSVVNAMAFHEESIASKVFLTTLLSALISAVLVATISTLNTCETKKVEVEEEIHLEQIKEKKR